MGHPDLLRVELIKSQALGMTRGGVGASVNPLPSRDRKHTRHSREPEQLLDPRIHPNNTQPNPLALAPNIMADQHPKPGRIHIRNLRQIKHVRWRLRIPWRRFENIAKRVRRKRVIHIPARKWASQAKHHTNRLTFTAFDRESCSLPYLRFRRCHSLPFNPPREYPSSSSARR
jgi:hypothetical protein